MASIGWMREIADRLNLLRGAAADQTTRKLRQAGFLSRDASVVYVFVKLALPLALGFLTLPLLEVDGWLDVPGEVTYAGAIALLLVAFVLTIWSGYEFFRDVWKQRHAIRKAPAA